MIQIPDEYFEVESAVYKLSYGDRYVIIKGKTLTGSIYLFERGYAAFVSAGGGQGRNQGGEGQKQWDGTNTFYFKFYSYIHNNPKLPFKVEVLLESNNGYQLLKREQQELNASIRDKKCLNSNVEAYVNKYSKKTGSYGWLSKGHVLAFKKFLKS